MSGRKVILRYAAPLRENALPAPAPAPAPTPAHDLPGSFPAGLLDAEQLEAVQTWFDAWQAEVVERIRAALCLPPDADGREGSRQNLAEFGACAVVLAHMLRLHPAASQSLPVLARALGVRERKLYHIRQGILAALGGKAAPPPRRAAGLKRLADIYPQLDFSRRTGRSASRSSVYIVPFRWRATLMAQFDTVLSLSAIPGITATLALTAADEDAVRITLSRPATQP